MRPPSRQIRLSLPATVLAALLGSIPVVAGCAASPGASGAPRGSQANGISAAPAAAASLPASDVLRAWDRARARAFAGGDVAALRRLYVDRSAAGTSDVRLLRAYLRRGLRVEGMRMQLLAVQVLHEDLPRLRLRVTDRLTGAVAVGDGSRTRLPDDQASTRVVELRRPRDGGSWRVAAVRSAPRRAAR